MSNIAELIAVVKDQHQAGDTLGKEPVGRFERRTGWRLPADLAQFYESCYGAQLFEGKYTIADPDDLRRLRIAIANENDDSICPPSWFAVCDVQDGNFVAIDLAQRPDGSWNVIDCFHETIGGQNESAIIARSFTEFLERALSSGGKLYWLDESFEDYRFAQ